MQIEKLESASAATLKITGEIDLHASPELRDRLQECAKAKTPLLLLDFTGDELLLTVDAPMHGDAPPPGAPGPTPGLWEHEVVEVFLLGDDDRYLEVELGPAGHHLVLSLSGRRQVVAQGFDLHFEVERGPGRWRGRARVPLLWLPDGLNRVNATAIHGPAWRRSYSASFAGTGPRPDFHRLEDFGPLP